jgi:hypothetical protein
MRDDGAYKEQDKADRSGYPDQWHADAHQRLLLYACQAWLSKPPAFVILSRTCLNRMKSIVAEKMSAATRTVTTM